MHEKRFTGDPARLRAPERLQRLQPARAAGLCAGGMESVLDVGTGTGIFAGEFAAMGLRTEGVDASPEMLDEARKFVPGASFRQGTAETLPYDGGSFDMVFMGMLLHETDSPDRAMEESARVAKKRVAILEWPYLEQESGPKLAERLPPETVNELGVRAGLTQADQIEHNGLILYIFNKKEK